jgi:hypothetical protein
MKKQLLALLGLGLLRATASAYAQSTKLKATVPFNFVVTGGTLLSGEYTIRPWTDSEHELRIKVMGQSSRVFLAVPCLTLKGEVLLTRPSWVFERYGNQYFLSEIWVKGRRVGQKLPKTRRQIEMAQRQHIRVWRG